MDENFSQKMLKLMKHLNRIVSIEDAIRKGCLPFFVDNKQVGLIRGDFWSQHLKTFPDIFLHVANDNCTNDLKPGVHLQSAFPTYESRSAAVNKVLEQLRDKDAIPALRGWRHENYAVSQRSVDKPVLEVERAGSGLFGFIQYGVHVNGFTLNDNGETMMWIGRRSKTKQTFPDMFDNMCAGGLPAGMGVKECVVKECQEEASVPDTILEKLQWTGTVSYLYEDERGVFPECQYIYDLELPDDFKPVNADGEVGSFELVSLEKLKSLLLGDNFKPNCAAVCLDFLIRHGFMDPDTDPNCSLYVEQMHVPLQTIYHGK